MMFQPKLYQSIVRFTYIQCNSLMLLHAKKDVSKFLSILTAGLHRSIKFDWVRKSNAIELSQNFFSSIVFD